MIVREKGCPLCGGNVTVRSAAGLNWAIKPGVFVDIPPSILIARCDACDDYALTDEQVREIEAAIVAEEHEMSTESKPQPNPKPTIGRIVHYHRPDFPDRNKLITFAAMITGVDYERGVNLIIFLDEETAKSRGKTLYLRSVPFCEKPTAYAWSWPPRDGS